ncbi:hypothetical protein [Streptomyces zagrosensis]|uniref:Transposase n=1 Tax=Streptomyces zagrosensis TaxID=1042984 RepID=A0A7W9Q8F5_9ACTN|nr:hypothetical protein [Streptomyces zagrosensis]MBB5935515.1 hypothetical protein [Streptomyces zagrosensis]
MERLQAIFVRYCGAPIQTACEYANACLDCRFFITTGDFLNQHRRQRNETRKLIGDAEEAGFSRIVEKNTRTLGKLDPRSNETGNLANRSLTSPGNWRPSTARCAACACCRAPRWWREQLPVKPALDR